MGFWDGGSTAAIGALSGLASGLGTRRQQGRQFRHNKQLAEYSFDRQYQMWDEAWQRETQYNDPSNQMARYRKAGINPHMAYMTGGGQNTAQTGALPQYSQEGNEVGPSMGQIAGNAIANALNTKMQSLAIKEKEEDIRTKKANANTTEIQSEYLSRRLGIDLKDLQGAYEYDNLGKYLGHTSRYGKAKTVDYEIKSMERAMYTIEQGLKNAQKNNLISDGKLKEVQANIAQAKWGWLEDPQIKKMIKTLGNKFGKAIGTIMNFVQN